MRKFMTICAMCGVFSVLGLAETWNGTLMDATCYARHGSSRSCDARPSTQNFMLEVNGTRYKFDGATNERARAAIRDRADRAANPDATKSTPVNAKVTGNMRSSGKIHAETIELQ